MFLFLSSRYFSLHTLVLEDLERKRAQNYGNFFFDADYFAFKWLLKHLNDALVTFYHEWVQYELTNWSSLSDAKCVL